MTAFTLRIDPEKETEAGADPVESASLLVETVRAVTTGTLHIDGLVFAVKIASLYEEEN